MFRSSYRIATVWGIPIRIHISLIILLCFLGLSMAMTLGLAGVLLLLYIEAAVFTSIALHELGHSFVAFRKGCRVREITLLFIGGAAQMEEIPTRPRDELQMAIAGPAVSVCLGFLLWFAGSRLPLARLPWPIPLLRIAVPCNLVQLPGLINFALATFNLLPSFPMDGGRILRAALTPRLGRLRATFIAVRLGRIVAILLGLYGLFFAHSFLLIAIAVFVFTMGGKEYRLAQMQEPWTQARGDGPDSEVGQGAPTDNQVLIGPPPYRNVPGIRADVQVEDDEGPFAQ